MCNNDKYQRILIYMAIFWTLVVLVLTGFSHPFRRVSLIFTLVLGTHFLFSLFLWKNKHIIKWLRKLQLFNGPFIHGKWEGEMVSTWIDPKTNKPLPPIPCQIEIKQKFDRLSVRMKTKQSQSDSVNTCLHYNPENETCTLWYNYQNTSFQDNREDNPIHFGSVRLNVIEEGNSIHFEGEYWTSRKTSGSMVITKKIEKKR